MLKIPFIIAVQEHGSMKTPKNPKVNANDLLKFIETLWSQIGRLLNIIAGDSNIDLLQKKCSTNIIQLLNSFNYLNCHTLVTRRASGT